MPQDMTLKSLGLPTLRTSKSQIWIAIDATIWKSGLGIECSYACSNYFDQRISRTRNGVGPWLTRDLLIFKTCYNFQQRSVIAKHLSYIEASKTGNDMHSLCRTPPSPIGPALLGGFSFEKGSAWFWSIAIIDSKLCSFFSGDSIRYALDERWQLGTSDPTFLIMHHAPPPSSTEADISHLVPGKEGGRRLGGEVIVWCLFFDSVPLWLL